MSGCAHRNFENVCQRELLQHTKKIKTFIWLQYLGTRPHPRALAAYLCTVQLIKESDPILWWLWTGCLRPQGFC